MRKGQKSLNMWIEESIHKSIKQKASQRNITVKAYLLSLHQLELNENILDQKILPRNNPPGDNKWDDKINEMEDKIMKLFHKVDQQQIEIKSTNIIDKIGFFESKNLMKSIDSIENSNTPFNSKIEYKLKDIKNKNKKAKLESYRSTIEAIMNGNQDRKSIESYRGKNTEKPLKRLIEFGILEEKFLDPSNPRKRTYEIHPDYIE